MNKLGKWGWFILFLVMVGASVAIWFQNKDEQSEKTEDGLLEEGGPGRELKLPEMEGQGNQPGGPQRMRDRPSGPQEQGAPSGNSPNQGPTGLAVPPSNNSQGNRAYVAPPEYYRPPEEPPPPPPQFPDYGGEPPVDPNYWEPPPDAPDPYDDINPAFLPPNPMDNQEFEPPLQGEFLPLPMEVPEGEGGGEIPN